MLGFLKIDLMNYFYIFNSISFYSFNKYSRIYINVFLKIPLCLIKLSRIAFLSRIANNCKEILYFQWQPPTMFYKKVLLNISQNSKESTCARASF